MKEKDILLQKYLAGETSLQEENQLKQILTESSDLEYDSYKKAFLGFKGVKQRPVLSTNFERNLLAKLRYSKRRSLGKVFQYTSLSVAASLLFAIGFFTLTQKNEAYVIEKGVRYDDMEKAVGCADEAINEAIAPLKQSMQSLQPIKGLEGSLTPSYDNSISNDSNLKSDVLHDSMIETSN